MAILGGLLAPVSWLFNWLIMVILFSLAAALIDGFRLKNGLSSAGLSTDRTTMLLMLVLI